MDPAIQNKPTIQSKKLNAFPNLQSLWIFKMQVMYEQILWLRTLTQFHGWIFSGGVGGKEWVRMYNEWLKKLEMGG